MYERGDDEQDPWELMASDGAPVSDVEQVRATLATWAARR